MHGSRSTCIEWHLHGVEPEGVHSLMIFAALPIVLDEDGEEAEDEKEQERLETGPKTKKKSDDEHEEEPGDDETCRLGVGARMFIVVDMCGGRSKPLAASEGRPNKRP